VLDETKRRPLYVVAETSLGEGAAEARPLARITQAGGEH
jgi:hypothetical protein